MHTGNECRLFLTRHVHVARFLLAEGADPLLRDARRGRTALHLAVSRQRADVVRLLVSDGTRVHAQGAERPLREALLPDGIEGKPAR